MKNHPFHLVDNRPWPLTGAIGLITIITGTIIWFHHNQTSLIYLGIITTLLTIIQWWRDVVRESTFQGLHTKRVAYIIKWGMILFITSEIFFFLSFFWAFFHRSLSPRVEIGINWPPSGIKTFNPIRIPILNTLILLSSGISITWAHNAILNKNYTQSIHRIMITVLLGIYFTILQGLEYYEAPFTIADSIYGSSFFIRTGFHGIHVLIGTIFITVSLLRLAKLHISRNHHVGFEASAWYWHFVDVVWLFLYISVYWWGG